MPVLSRADNSMVGRWWWSVDRATLVAIGALIGFGYVLVLAASPAVAEHLKESRDALVLKQVFFLAVALAIVIAVSLLPPKDIRRLALIGCGIALALTAMTLVIGVSIKGGRRWIALPGFSLQPSEFLKPCFAVTAAWLLAEAKRGTNAWGTLAACGIFGIILVLLPLQPDIGMTAVITAVFAVQLYLSGVPIVLMGGLAGLGAAMAGAAYVALPHVHSRVQRFLHPDAVHGNSDNYQVDTALQAFGNGGLLGRGPGEGHIKDILPDAHADFVYAVAGEEYGLVVCALILGLFVFIVLRGLRRAEEDSDLFCALASSGLVCSFGLQAFINMASTLHLIPTKGMTLPFISYGGSSAVAVALSMGMLLALTRRRWGGETT
jgi:cell division protein FtsW